MNITEIETIVKDGYSYKVYPNNIIYIKYDDGVFVDIHLMKEVVNVILNTFKNQKFRTVIDFSNNTGKMSEEAKRFSASDEKLNKYKTCEALVTNSYTISILIGLYVSFFKPKSPTKSFSKINDALEWVLTFKN